MLVVEDCFLHVTKMIMNEFDQAIIILDQDNCILLANNYAKALYGITTLPVELEQLVNVFGGVDLYHSIAQLAFNYHWHGILPVNSAQGMEYKMSFRAKFVPDEKCVVHHLLLIGTVSCDPAVSIREEGNGVIDQAQFRDLCEISMTINSNHDFQNICNEVTMRAAKLIGADRSLLYSVNDSHIGVFATWNMTDEEKNLFYLVDMEHGVIKNCLRNMAPVLVHCYSQHIDWIPEIYDALNFESFILYPLLAQKQLVGVLALFGTEPMKFNDQHIMLLQMISTPMAIALINAQMYSEIQRLNKHLEQEVSLKVNELRISELQLIRKNNELEAIFHSITDILIVVDEYMRIIEINEAAIIFYGFEDKRSLLGKKYCDKNCAQKMCRLSECGIHCVKTEFGSCNEHCYLKDTIQSGKPVMTEINVGKKVYMISVYPIFDEDMKAIKAVCFMRDTTFTKRKNEELIQHQKMLAIGQLAAGVAHEIRNPLGAISNYTYILEEWLERLQEQDVLIDADIHNAFTAIKKLVERSENVIRNLLDFSRINANEITTSRFDNIMEKILMLVGKTAQRNNVRILTIGAPDVTVRTDSNALQHILFNLVFNAIDALPDGGEIEVKVNQDSDWVIFQVSDNGSGIKQEDLEKVFNPFYTTKAPDRGTGLGLYVVYNLVQQLRGSISVESQLGIGTAFTVKLPSVRKL